MVPVNFLETYEAARQRAGLVDRADFGRIVVSGKDRASYLHGLLTNDVTSLRSGQGCYAAYLTAQGRMIADLWVYELGDVILLRLLRDVKDTVMSKLAQFIFTEDVQVGDVTGTFAALGVIGPDAPGDVATALGLSQENVAALPEHGNMRASFNGQPAIVLRVTDLGEPGYDVLVESSMLSSLRSALHSTGAIDIDDVTAEALRVEHGVPRFHRDMDEETIPLEAGIESRAISLTKGCYVGQEVIIRVLHRGHGRVARKLVGLVFDDGATPAAGADVQSGGSAHRGSDERGLVACVERPVALAYLQRDFLEPGTRVSVGGRSAEVTALPFVGS